MYGKIQFHVFAMILASAALVSSSATAQDVSARISTREAYVGMPVVLQIAISNAENYQLPDLPEIDGCSVRAAGSPSQSSQITIINGRRSESRSVTMQYLITPRRAGTFEIPALTMEVDGQQRTTQPQQFVAVKSETGDLMFVEVEGGDQRVFVGQSLDLKLKIWLKPFRDRQQRIELSEGQMWQLVSDQSSFGSFSDQMKEMAANNERPRGQEVLRDVGQGNRRSYYLYEIDATIYPTRPGRIDASDIQIVVQYPTRLGRSRDPFEGMFGDSPFGGSSLMRQMMDDDFFRSPFGRRLTVSEARPIVAEVKTDATEVLPIPTQGRPADYRGAVGRYQMIAEAEPVRVQAGDPITLRLGIVGNGPMELVQAPPLPEIASLTADFKVTDQSLAGFVRDETKVFVTTVRPRKAGISQIPPIPFSFFDPETESFETVYSEPIAIEVEQAETLSLDSIVSNTPSRRDSGMDGERDDGTGAASIAGLDLQNHGSSDVLEAQDPAQGNMFWWLFVVAPPIAWLAVLSARTVLALFQRVPGFGVTKSSCLKSIAKATDQRMLIEAMTRLIASQTKCQCETPQQAVGALRISGLTEVANEVESLFDRLQREAAGGTATEQSLDAAKVECRDTVNRLVDAIAFQGRTMIRRPGQNRRRRLSQGHRRSQVAGLLMIAIGLTAGPATAAEMGQDNAGLEPGQQQSILVEALQLYQEGQQMSASDSAEASDLFARSAAKYRQLVDAGVVNSKLYVNLGNAQLQSGQLGQALANYQRAVRLDPSNRQANNNLQFARSKVDRGASEARSDVPVQGWNDLRGWNDVWAALGWLNQRWIQLLGWRMMFVLLGIASVLFWLLAIVRTAGYRIPFWRLAMVPLLCLICCGLSLGLHYQHQSDAIGVLVADAIELRQADGFEFPVVRQFDSSQGNEVRIIVERGDWIKVEWEPGVVGWIPASVVERI